MLQLLQPIWLFGLTGLIVPVLIHFWNQRPGKTLKVGSIALITANARRYKKRIQLSDILLLLLRCLLLALVAVTLATPVWLSREQVSSKGWVLIPRMALAATYQRFKPRIDSLLQAGYQFHFFEPGFPEGRLADSTNIPSGSSQSDRTSYRDIIAGMDETVPSGFPLYVFTDNYLRHFAGDHRTVSLNLHWSMYTAAAPPEKKAMDSTPLYATIYTGRHASDARYVKAALEAIKEEQQKPIIITSVSAINAIPARQDWLFWLEENQPVSLNKTKHVLRYAGGKRVSQPSYIVAANTVLFDPVPLYQRILPDSLALQQTNYWQDGFGHPMLTVAQENGMECYDFYCRFDPAWSGLPWNGQFPAMLGKLLYTGNSDDEPGGVADRTIIDSEQAMPFLTNKKEAGFFGMAASKTNLAAVCWLLVLLLFVVERLLSFHYYKAKSDG